MCSLTSEGVDNVLPSLGAQLEDLPTTHMAPIFSAIMLIQAIGKAVEGYAISTYLDWAREWHVGLCLSKLPRVVRSPRLAQDKAWIGFRIHRPREQSCHGQ